MYSIDDMRLCWQFAGGDPSSFDKWIDFHFSDRESDDNVNDILYEWKYHKHLHQYRNVSTGIKKAIKKALKEYDVDQCVDAIKHYAEIQASDYFMKYKWDIETFFIRKKGAPEFMNDGLKWINYKDSYKPTVKPYSTVSDTWIKAIEANVDSFISQYKNINYPYFSINSMSESKEEVEKERKLAFNSKVNNTVYPIIYCHVCNENMVYIDEFTTKNNVSFMTKFGKIVYKDGTQKDIKKEFEKLNL